MSAWTPENIDIVQAAALKMSDHSLWPDIRFYPYKLTIIILQQKLTVHAKRTRPDENVLYKLYLCYLLLFQE